MEEGVQDGIFGLEHVESFRLRKAPVGEIGGHGVCTGFRHDNRCRGRTIAPEIRERFRAGYRSERHGRVRTEELRTRNGHRRGRHHRQVQGVCAGTTLGVGILIGINTRFCIGDIMPNITVASGYSIDIMGTMVDDQMQGHGTVCTMLVGECPLITSCLRVY